MIYGKFKKFKRILIMRKNFLITLTSYTRMNKMALFELRYFYFI